MAIALLVVLVPAATPALAAGRQVHLDGVDGAAAARHPPGGDGQPHHGLPRPGRPTGCARTATGSGACAPPTAGSGTAGWSRPRSVTQGTGTTPLGTFRLPWAFGTHARQAGWSLGYRRIHRGDFWVEDNRSRFYNRYRNQSQGGFRWRLPASDPNSSERLSDYPRAVRVLHRHQLQLPPGPAPRRRDLPARQRIRRDGRLRQRPASVPAAADGAARPRPGAGHRDRAMSPAGAAGGPRRRRGPHAADQQPRQGALPAHRHHQGRGAQLLRADRPHPAAAPRGPCRDPDPLAARGRGASFFEKNVPAGTPSWVRTVTVPTTGSRAVALGARRGSGHPDLPDRRRPGHPDLAGQPRRARAARPPVDGGPQRAPAQRRPARHRPRPGRAGGAARVLRGRAAGARQARRARPGTPSPVTSGSKGLHLYADLPRRMPSDDSTALAKEVAEELQGEHPQLVTATMTKARRSGKVFLDWSQNAGVEDHHLAVLPARPGAPVRRHARLVGRGRGRARRTRSASSSSGTTRCSTGSPTSATCSRPADPSAGGCYRTVEMMWTGCGSRVARRALALRPSRAWTEFR